MIENTEIHNLKVYNLCEYNWSTQRIVERDWAEAISKELVTEKSSTLMKISGQLCV